MTSRPQDPVAPVPYREQAVLLDGGEPGVKLAGTLTLPSSDARVPAVLLIPGSGPQDRDEHLCGHRPFLVLADHLTRSGIAVLRLDDRGVGGSTGDKDQCTHDELLLDVRGALDFLAAHPTVDARRVGLVGHSEGAVLAAAAAARYEHVAAAVLMAGPACPGAQTIHEQAALISRLSGATDEQVAHERRMNEAVFEVLGRPLVRDAARTALLPVIARYLADWPDQCIEGVELETGAEAMADVVLAPAFRSFLACDPACHLERVGCPVFALFAQLDVQVPPGIHVPPLRKALSAAGNADVTIEAFAGLNHLFQTAETGALAEYEAIEETIAPAVLDRISGWILSRLGGE